MQRPHIGLVLATYWELLERGYRSDLVGETIIREIASNVAGLKVTVLK